VVLLLWESSFQGLVVGCGNSSFVYYFALSMMYIFGVDAHLMRLGAIDFWYNYRWSGYYSRIFS